MNDKKLVADKKTLVELQKEGLKFALYYLNSKVPKKKGWLEEPSKRVVECYDEVVLDGNTGFKGLLTHGDFVVIDIDEVKETKAKEIMTILDDAGCWKAMSNRGVHYWFKKCEQSDELLKGLTRQDIRSVSGKVHIGDILGRDANIYPRVFGDLMTMSEVKGLFSTITDGELPTSEKLTNLKRKLTNKISNLPDGERHNKMFGIIHETVTAIKNLMLQEKIDVIAKHLSDCYLELNHEDNSYPESRIKEILETEVKLIKGESETSKELEENDITCLLFDEMLRKRNNNVLVTDDSTDINKRAVSIWDDEKNEWVKERVGSREVGEDKQTMIQEFQQRFKDLYYEKYDYNCTQKTLNEGIDEFKKAIKNNITFHNIDSIFDICDENKNRVYIGDGKALDIVFSDDKEKKWNKRDRQQT